MAKNIIMPALGMAQETGVLINWLKGEGDSVVKGEPLMEVETDKATVEIEAPESGFLGGVTARAGDVIPVGQTIAWILAAGEQPPSQVSLDTQTNPVSSISQQSAPRHISVEVSPLARKIAEEQAIDLALVKSNGKRIEKADVLAYINATSQTTSEPAAIGIAASTRTRLTPASPKARRLARERGIDISILKGSGPHGAVLAEDVPLQVPPAPADVSLETPSSLSSVWRIMAERMTSSWTTVPHFYLMREVEASNLVEWRSRISTTVEKKSGVKPTYTDLLVKLIGVTLREHPRVNAVWTNGNIQFNKEVNVGLAVAVEDGLIVPVIRNADSALLSEIASRRKELIGRAQERKVRPADISDGTFTLSNLGMYNVDAFSAIVNPPQAAILAVGRIIERVVPIHGQVEIRPMMVMTLSCDHRVVDGARAAQFLDDLANLIQDPWRLLA